MNQRKRIKSSKLVELTRRGDGLADEYLLGFGQDLHGELYVLANATAIPFLETGVVYRVVPGIGR